MASFERNDRVSFKDIRTGMLLVGVILDINNDYGMKQFLVGSGNGRPVWKDESELLPAK